MVTPNGSKDLALSQKRWYVVHVLTGHEKKVKDFLEAEIIRKGMGDLVNTILIPSESVIEMKDGKKKAKNRVFFPGYMLIEMELNKDTQHLILNSPSILNFVGPKNRPQPLRDQEVNRILGTVERGKGQEVMEFPYKVGDAVKVIDGPFNEFSGFVKEINEEKKKVKVMVSIFGRSTPVELDFLQVKLEE